mmetsp:Transcript_31845/g.74151  ORF Transcript_31845/g.74151 Transcript_31845/m.74151 type:complete len:377 (-) Transcript_31845:337-1467(-)
MHLAVLLPSMLALPSPSARTLTSVSAPEGFPRAPGAAPSRALTFGSLKEYAPVQNPNNDLSGLAYMPNFGTFVAVHDAKVTETENDWVRVSFFKAPAGKSAPAGVQQLAADPVWPKDRKSNDLESIARIPGTNLLLLCESGDDGEDPTHDRIYLVEVRQNSIHMLSYTRWSTFYKPHNVEATAVAATSTGYIFVWAERESFTIQWADLELSYSPTSTSVTIGANGKKGSSTLVLQPDVVRMISRPCVGLDIGEDDGYIYAVSAFDADDDDGPFRSAVFRIGFVNDTKPTETMGAELMGSTDMPTHGTLVLHSLPQFTTFQDGFKVESVARCGKDCPTTADGQPITYIGTDDENFGGVLRPLKLGNFTHKAFTDLYK